MILRFFAVAVLIIGNVEAFASDAQAPAAKRIKLSETVEEVSEDEVNLEDLAPLIDPSSQGDQEAQKQILSYFAKWMKENYELDEVKYFIDQLALEKWKKYLEEYNPTFVALCITKADKDWVLPKQVEDQLRFLAKDFDDVDESVLSKLGNMYESGEGVAQDVAQAVEWFQRAAEKGDACDQIELARMYVESNIIKRDYDQAINWYLRVAHNQLSCLEEDRQKLKEIFMKHENFSKNDSTNNPTYERALTGLEEQV